MHLFEGNSIGVTILCLSSAETTINPTGAAWNIFTTKKLFKTVAWSVEYTPKTSSDLPSGRNVVSLQKHSGTSHVGVKVGILRLYQKWTSKKMKMRQRSVNHPWNLWERCAYYVFVQILEVGLAIFVMTYASTERPTTTSTCFYSMDFEAGATGWRIVEPEENSADD